MKNDGYAQIGFSRASYAARRGGGAACVGQQRLSSHFDKGKSGSVEPLFQQELWRSRPYFLIIRTACLICRRRYS